MPAGSLIRAGNKADRYYAARFPEFTAEEVALNKDRNATYIGLGLRVDAIVAQALADFSFGSAYHMIMRRFALALCKATEKRSGNLASYTIAANGLRAKALADLTPAPPNMSAALDQVRDQVFTIALPTLLREQ